MNTDAAAYFVQWDETLVLALAGMGRLLRAHLRTLLAVLPRFQNGWQELMLVVESSMAGGRHETAVAAITLLTTVLQVKCICVTNFWTQQQHHLAVPASWAMVVCSLMRCGMLQQLMSCCIV